MPGFTPAEQALIDVWDAHTAAEFEHKDADAAIATMTERPVLIHVPVGTGATGREPLRKFYREIFIPQMPPDFTLDLLTRTIDRHRLVDEFIVRFTHTVRMELVRARNRAHRAPARRPPCRHHRVRGGQDQLLEAPYWDQATVLLQLGLIEYGLPALGADQADRLSDPDAPANTLIDRLA